MNSIRECAWCQGHGEGKMKKQDSPPGPGLLSTPSAGPQRWLPRPPPASAWTLPGPVCMVGGEDSPQVKGQNLNRRSNAENPPGLKRSNNHGV